MNYTLIVHVSLPFLVYDLLRCHMTVTAAETFHSVVRSRCQERTAFSLAAEIHLQSCRRVRCNVVQ